MVLRLRGIQVVRLLLSYLQNLLLGARAAFTLVFDAQILIDMRRV